MRKKTIIGVVAGFAVGLAGAIGAVTIPNVFQPGAPAKASEVNANFAALANAVNSRLAIRDVNGVLFGDSISLDGNGNAAATLVLGSNVVRILVNKDGFQTANTQLFYELNNCTGTAYSESVSSASAILLGPDSNGLYYLAGATPTPIIANSFWNNGSCAPVSSTGPVAAVTALATTQQQFLASLTPPFKVVRTTAAVMTDIMPPPPPT